MADFVQTKYRHHYRISCVILRDVLHWEQYRCEIDKIYLLGEQSNL